VGEEVVTVTASPARSDVLEVEPEAALLALIQEARRARARREVGSIDYARAVRRALRDTRVSQVRLAQLLHVSQPTLSEMSRRDVQEPLAGFCGATPYEIAQRYAAGDIDRDQMLEELIRYPYLPTPHSDGYDSLLVFEPGMFEDVAQAARDGLIDDETYDDILEHAEHLTRAV
jgi:hypothetical protein